MCGIYLHKVEAASLTSWVLCSALEKPTLATYYSRACARIQRWNFEVLNDVFRVKSCSRKYDNGNQTMRFVELSDLKLIKVSDYE